MNIVPAHQTAALLLHCSGMQSMPCRLASFSWRLADDKMVALPGNCWLAAPMLVQGTETARFRPALRTACSTATTSSAAKSLSSSQVGCWART